MTQITLKIEVQSIRYYNPDNQFYILKFRDLQTGVLATATGYCPELQQGQHYEASGSWLEHPRFGRQLKLERLLPIRPTTKEGMIKFLSSGLFKGVGKKTATKIVKFFGVDTLQALDEDPEAVRQVPKLNKNTMSQFLESWAGERDRNQVLLFLIDLGLGMGSAHRIYGLYGAKTKEKLHHNPYQLIYDLRGIGFIKADQIGRQLGLAEDSVCRISEAILYVLREAENQGHCYLLGSQINERVQKLGQSELKDSLIQQSFEKLKERQRIVSAKGQDEIYYLMDLFVAEERVRSFIKDRINSSKESTEFEGQRVRRWLEEYQKKARQELNEEQKNAVEQAVASSFFILTGGPGVGKTTTANVIIKLFKAMGKSIVLAAPTGRAAQRIQEVSGLPAKTIHRLLEWSWQEGCFKKGEDQPLLADVIMLDEVSMIDIRLAEALVKSIKENTQVIFIGDPDQLPSVGPGMVLQDMMSYSSLPRVTLKAVFRQAKESAIIAHAHQLNQGQYPEFKNDPSSDCWFVECETGKDMQEQVSHLLVSSLPRAGYDPKEDVQILVPMNKGDWGAQDLNILAQGLLNKEKRNPLSKFNFGVGDKVIQLVNNYELQVYNGDIGFVIAVNVEHKKTIVQFQDRMVDFDEEQACDLSLAYAVTIHKAQGSEFPVVIIPISMSHYVLLERNLVYTGLTRAKKLAVFVGQKKALYHAIRHSFAKTRQTRLSELYA